jgi:hypothetical protein
MPWEQSGCPAARGFPYRHHRNRGEAGGDALAKGATCIVLKHTLDTGETYENVFTIHII